jgi:hypothetical protein
MRLQVRLDIMRQRFVDVKVSFRLIGAIERMRFTFSLGQPTSVHNALSAAVCYSGGGDDGSHGRGSDDTTGEEVILAVLRSSPSP